MGISRVILSRELSLDEVAEIRQECPDMELEVFVHGALCIAYSGRCLLSGYFNHRDPNQGTCTNSCRWEYSVTPTATDAGGDGARQRPQPGRLWLVELTAALRPEATWLLEEKMRAGRATCRSRRTSTAPTSSTAKDLRAIEHMFSDWSTSASIR
jgi:putative protease